MAEYGERPFGLRELRIVNGATNVALPVAMTMQVTERVITGELSGDDRLQSVVSFPNAAELNLEAGGISLGAYAALTGRTATETGTTPNQEKTLAVTSDDRYPYVEIYGRSLGEEETDDIWIHIFKAKVTEAPSGTFGLNQFYQTGLKLLAVADASNSNLIFEILQHETAEALPTS